MAFFCDEVDAYIVCVVSCLEFRPVFIEIDFGELFFVVGVFSEICQHQPLEKFAFSVFGCGSLSDVIERALEAGVGGCAGAFES